MSLIKNYCKANTHECTAESLLELLECEFCDYEESCTADGDESCFCLSQHCGFCHSEKAQKEVDKK